MNCSDPSESASKRVHPSIESYFRANPRKSLDVMIVLDAPQPDLSFMIPNDTDFGNFGSGNLPPSKPESKEFERISDKMRKKLTELGVKRINWLPNAQTFFATLNAKQVESVSQQKEVLEIVPNEQLR